MASVYTILKRYDPGIQYERGRFACTVLIRMLDMTLG